MFGWLKNEALEVIEWREDSQDTVLYKFPDKDCNIKYGAQLTVRESQAALFLNEGQLADIYYPGRHTLTTENMPILTTLKSWKFGFNSPFKADVYFISTRQFANLKWGTPNAIFIRDPEMGAVQIRAFGVYFMRIKDPKIFFREYAGTNDLLTIDQLQDTLRGLIAPKFAEALSKSKVSAFDIYANYSTLGDQIRPLLQADLDLFGLELTKFQITSVSLPPELESHFTDMAKLNTTSDKNIDKLTRIKQANAVEKAAENGNYENFNMSQMMMQQMMMQNQMTQQNLQNQNNNQGFNQNQQQTPPAPKPSRDEIMKSLKDLGELKSMGILTEAEFEQKKKELLAQL